jgi:hypothetical protein
MPDLIRSAQVFSRSPLWLTGLDEWLAVVAVLASAVLAAKLQPMVGPAA